MEKSELTQVENKVSEIVWKVLKGIKRSDAIEILEQSLSYVKVNDSCFPKEKGKKLNKQC